MTNRHAYMRQWQAKRRWPIQVETALKRLETLLAARPDGQALPAMPAAVRAAWGLDVSTDDLTDQQRTFLGEVTGKGTTQKFRVKVFKDN